MEYNVDYFIAKFEAIPEDKWCTFSFIDYKGNCCALGHCGNRNYNEDTPEAKELRRIMRQPVSAINDGHAAYQNLGSTPKQRIINALKQLKNERNKIQG